jgi:hypothetical protein
MTPRFAGIRDAIAPHNGTETSREAARSIEPHRNAQTQTVLDWLRTQKQGATREEIATGTGIKLQSVCVRVYELLKSQDVTECGTRATASGRNAAVVMVNGGAR